MRKKFAVGEPLKTLNPTLARNKKELEGCTDLEREEDHLRL